MIQGLAHLTHQELGFFSFEKRFQSGVGVCKRVSIYVKTSWKGVKKWSQTLLSGIW